MAHFVFTNGFFSWNAVDLSSHVKSIEVNVEKEMVDDTMMADTAQVNLAGLQNWSMEIEFGADEAASQVMATLWSDFDAGTARTVIARPTASAVSATNPNYTGSGLISNLSPIGGTVGELARTRVTISPAGALSRATS